MAMVDLGTLTWTTGPRGRHLSSLPSGIKIVPNTEVIRAICSQYKTVKGNDFTATDNSVAMLNLISLGVNDSALNGVDADTFKSAMSGVMLCYELATPTPISTTPTEISTVEGQNNVFSPDGDVTVEYAADLKTYIDSKIAAAVAALS